jgi:O-antigen/teichoic acid export membrane protein
MPSPLNYIQAVRKSSSFWALSDQAVLSLGSFVTNIALMRAYKHDEKEFAVYALIISTIALMNNLHASVVTYPLSVKGAPAPLDELRRLTSSSILLTFFWAIPLFLMTLVAVLYLRHPWLMPSVGLAMICWQLQETTRRALMAHLQHHRAIWGDLISYFLQAGFVLLLCSFNTPSLTQIFLTIAGTSLAAAVLQAWQLGIGKFDFQHAKQLGLTGWKIGRWMLMSNGLNFLTIQMVAWMVYSFHDAEFAAAFFALSTMLGVSHPVMFGISGLIVPGVAKASHEHGPSAAKRYAIKLGALGLLLLLPFYLFLLIAPHMAIRLVAGAGSPYLQYTFELRLLVLQYLVIYASIVSTAYLNGLEAARSTFFGQLVNGISSVVFRLPITAIGGMAAAIWSGAITYGLQLIVNFVSIRNRNRPRQRAEAEPVLALEA